MDKLVVEKGLLLFIEYHDDKFAEMTKFLAKLDYIDCNDKVLYNCSQAIISLKRTFTSFAADALAFMTHA